MNIERIKQKIIRAIEKAPTTITLMRPGITEDDYGNEIENPEPIEVDTITGILDNSSHGALNIINQDGGNFQYEKQPKFITTYSGDTSILPGDYFNLNGDLYTVTNPVNVLNLNIYWEINLDRKFGGGQSGN